MVCYFFFFFSLKEHVMFAKSANIIQQTVDSAVWYWFALPLFANHCLSWLGREKHIKDVVFLHLLATSEDSGRLAKPQGFFWIKLPLLICEWCLQVDQATTADSSELNCWYPDNADWILTERTISKQVCILFFPNNLSFPLPLVGDWLEGRLKHLSTLIKVGFEKYKPTQ